MRELPEVEYWTRLFEDITWELIGVGRDSVISDKGHCLMNALLNCLWILQ